MTTRHADRVFVGPVATIVVPDSGAGRAAASSLSSVVSMPNPFAALVAVLLGIVSTSGLDALPAVAAVVHGGGAIRLLLRGEVSAAAVTVDGTILLEGAGVATWVERRLFRATHVRLLAGGVEIDVNLPQIGTPAVSDAVTPETLLLSEAPRKPESPELVNMEIGVGRPPEIPDAAEFVPQADDDGFSDTGYDFDQLPVLEDPSHLVAASKEAPGPPSLIDSVPGKPTSNPDAGHVRSRPEMSPLELSEALPLLAGDGTDDLCQTLVSEELQKLLSDLGRDSQPSTPEHGQLPALQAVRCPDGHPNAPHAERCRICSQIIVSQQIVSIRRPSLGHLVFSHGAVIELDRPVLIGRRPTRSGRVSATEEEPGLVAVPDPERCLSRTHAEIRLDGWQVLLVDRGSTNHTYVEAPGQPPQQLRANEQVPIIPRTRVLLGGSASFTFEVTT